MWSYHELGKKTFISVTFDKNVQFMLFVVLNFILPSALDFLTDSVKLW